MVRTVSFVFLLLISFTASAKTLLVVGDSLSAGYAMHASKSWPALLPTQLKHKGINLDVINASISGDTTGNGLARLPKLLSQHHPDYLLIALGANDGLRGFSPNTINNNLKAMINKGNAYDAQAILIQMRVPPNYGKRYSDSFAAIYTNISKQQDVPLIPFFLEQVIVKPQWMMSDGLHPNADAQPWIAEFIATELAQIIKDS